VKSIIIPADKNIDWDEVVKKEARGIMMLTLEKFN
jgi:hypothetical protein